MCSLSARNVHPICVHTTDQPTNYGRIIYLSDVTKEAVSNWVKGLFRPLTEPVNGAAVDQWGKLTQTRPKNFTNRTKKLIIAIIESMHQ